MHSHFNVISSKDPSLHPFSINIIKMFPFFFLATFFHAFGIILFMHFSTTFCIEADLEENRQMEMLNKLQFNYSRNVMGMEMLKYHDPESVKFGTEWNMLSLYGIGIVDRPNLDIQFDEENWTCSILVYSDEAFENDRAKNTESNFANCLFLHEDRYYVEPFCFHPNLKFDNKLQKANGIFNVPSETPKCLYDFYNMANNFWDEYSLLKYCAKGYFFQNRDYDDPKRLQYRKDWILYLMNGAMHCGISEKIDVNEKLLRQGYQMKFVQKVPNENFLPHPMCANLTATISSYEDKRADGKFMMAAIFGSALLDYRDLKSPDDSFWSYKRVQETLPKKTEDAKQNEIWTWPLLFMDNSKYLECIRQPKDGRYFIELHIQHYCTPRGLKANLVLVFNVSIGPNQLPENIYEDTNVRIYLDRGTMERSTGQQRTTMPEQLGPFIVCEPSGNCTGVDHAPPGRDTCCAGCHSCTYFQCCHCSYTNPATHCAITGWRSPQYTGGKASG